MDLPTLNLPDKTEVSPHSDILSLFQKDPLGLTRTDITAIITKMRASRSQFSLGATKAGSTKPPTKKQAATLEIAKTLSLKDLKL